MKDQPATIYGCIVSHKVSMVPIDDTGDSLLSDKSMLIPDLFQQIFSLPFLITCFAVEKPMFDTVMRICTMTMYYFTKQTETLHIKSSQIILTEAPVFEHHAGNSGLFR